MVDLAASVAREFKRKRLTPQMVIILAQEALQAGRVDDGERLVSLAYELLDFAAADANRE